MVDLFECIPFHSLTILNIRKDHFTVILRFICITIKSGGYLNSIFAKLSSFLCVLLTVHRDIIVVKKNQLDTQLILSIFLQPLHVSGVSRPSIVRYNHMYTTFVSYYSC